jgi:hypothetical protein
MLFFASGRVEGNVSFGCFGGKAAKTTEKDGYFLAATGGKARDAASINADCGSRVSEKKWMQSASTFLHGFDNLSRDLVQSKLEAV